MDAALLPAPPYSLDITSIQVSFMRPRDETVEPALARGLRSTA